MKTKNTDINRRKLMDKLSSPVTFGPLVGLIATTYEMQPEFFETDFLPGVLSLGAWDDRSWTSRVEIEKKLAHMESATVFVDASCYRNRPRSLRVKIVPVFLGDGRALHAKVVLLVYENAARLIVGSANLTQPGYRENREVVAVLTAEEKRPGQAQIIASALSQMPALLGRWWNPECNTLLKRVQDMIDDWGAPKSADGEWFFWGGGDEALWRSFVSKFPEGQTIKNITIVSPFWSDDDKHRSFVSLLEALRVRGNLVDGTNLRLLTEASPDSQTTYKPTLPHTFGAFDFSQLGLEVTAQAIDPQVLKEEVGMKGFIRSRHLHAKVVVLEGNSTSLAYIGSANFTRRGWGFLDDPTQANVEAGVVVLSSRVKEGSTADLIPDTTGPIVQLTGKASGGLAPPEGGPETVPWPQFITEALLTPSRGDPDRLDMLVTVDPEQLKGVWSLSMAEKASEGGERVLLDSKAYIEPSTSYRIELDEGALNSLLLEQEVIVRWWGSVQVQAYPVNVAMAARHALPVTPGQHRFSEQHLILYYQGRIAWEDLFPEPDGGGGEGDELDLLDDTYDRGVDTSRIQSYQIREFVEALQGIVVDLRAACKGTEPAMRLALLGPVSPVALARAVVDAVRRDGKSPVAAGFQLVEIRACLQEARLSEPSERHKETWTGYLDDATAEVDRLLVKLLGNYPEQFASDGAFSRYERRVREHYDGVGRNK